MATCEADQYNDVPQKGFVVCLKSISLEWRLKFRFASWIFKLYLEWRLGTRVISVKWHLSFTPYPLFEWYLQRKEILLNLSTKCSNSAFDAQGLRVIIVSSCIGRSKIWCPVSLKNCSQILWFDTHFHDKIVHSFPDFFRLHSKWIGD
jgi:hypothetical protein